MLRSIPACLLFALRLAIGFSWKREDCPAHTKDYKIKNTCAKYRLECEIIII